MDDSVFFHDLCGKPALIANWYGWCASCEDNAALARQLAEEFPDTSFILVLDENPLSEPVDADFCMAYQNAYPSPAQIWMDPEKKLEVYGSTDLILVLDQEGKIVFKRQTATESAIREAVLSVQ